MGLDVTAYRQLTPAPDGDAEDYEHFFTPHEGALDFTERNWPGRSKGVVGGTYRFADSFGFRAGSYGGYNQWRNWLAQMAGYRSAQYAWKHVAEGPFIELINFADNEGVIGPVVAAKLARDFAEHEERILAADAESPYFHEKYREWRKAFEMAADSGAVDFH